MAPQTATASSSSSSSSSSSPPVSMPGPVSPPSSPPAVANMMKNLPAFDVPSIALQLPPVAATATRLYLCRHGQTEYNRQHKYQGRGVDTVLNGAGLLQATCLAHAMRNVPLRAVYSSTLRRARETATIVAKFHPKLELEHFAELEEMSFGVMEGHDHARFNDQVLDIHEQWRHGDYSVKFPSGECPLDVVERGASKITALLERSVGGDHVLMVTHGRFNKVILTQLLHGSLESMHELTQDNTCVNVVDFDHTTRRFEAVALNSTIHLPHTLMA